MAEALLGDGSATVTRKGDTSLPWNVKHQREACGLTIACQVQGYLNELHVKGRQALLLR